MQKRQDFLRSGFLRWAILIGYSVFIFDVFTLPGDQIPGAVRVVNDKVLHLFVFLILALLAFRTFSSSRFPLLSVHSDWKAAGFSVLYGGFLEWMQIGVPGRDASIADWIADALGALAAQFIFWLARL